MSDDLNEKLSPEERKRRAKESFKARHGAIRRGVKIGSALGAAAGLALPLALSKRKGKTLDTKIAVTHGGKEYPTRIGSKYNFKTTDYAGIEALRGLSIGSGLGAGLGGLIGKHVAQRRLAKKKAKKERNESLEGVDYITLGKGSKLLGGRGIGDIRRMFKSRHMKKALKIGTLGGGALGAAGAALKAKRAKGKHKPKSKKELLKRIAKGGLKGAAIGGLAGAAAGQAIALNRASSDEMKKAILKRTGGQTKRVGEMVPRLNRAAQSVKRGERIPPEVLKKPTSRFEKENPGFMAGLRHFRAKDKAKLAQHISRGLPSKGRPRQHPRTVTIDVPYKMKEALEQILQSNLTEDEMEQVLLDLIG